MVIFYSYVKLPEGNKIPLVINGMVILGNHSCMACEWKKQITGDVFLVPGEKMIRGSFQNINSDAVSSMSSQHHALSGWPK
jgi:hypothetical protein